MGSVRVVDSDVVSGEYDELQQQHGGQNGLRLRHVDLGLV